MRKLLICTLLALMVALMPVSALARDIRLQWDANTEADLGGYHVFYKIDGPGAPYEGVEADLPSPIDVGNITTYTVTGLPELQPNQRYRFVVTAYSVIGLESGYSNEASAGVPTNPGNLVIVSSQP